jgi:hypothetical protein
VPPFHRVCIEPPVKRVFSAAGDEERKDIDHAKSEII